MTIMARAPARIDLAGGTLDIWPLYLLHPGSVTLNAAVRIHAEARVAARDRGFTIESRDRGLRVEGESAADLAHREPRLILAARLIEALAPERPLALELHAGAPAHAGLGGSSALAIATAAALDRFAAGSNATPDSERRTVHRTSGSAACRDHAQLLRVAMDVETAVIAVPTGQQDYAAALWGGIQALHWKVGGLQRERLASGDWAQRIVLCYTGAPRFSGANNWEVTRERIEGNAAVRRHLDAIRDAARAAVDAVRRGDPVGLGHAIEVEWAERRALSPRISTTEIDALGEAAIKAGAMAFKVCGAGGGGCVMALVEPDRRADVETALTNHGGELLPVEVDPQGLTVTAAERGAPTQPEEST